MSNPRQRLYIGRLPPDVRSDDVSKFFDTYGRIVDCRVMTGFGFVEFEAAKDAEDAVTHCNGKAFMGANIVVEFAKEGRPRREPYEDRSHGYGRSTRSRRPPGFRILVQNVAREVSWQDLKDFGRDAGNVTFADIDRDVVGQGILEYLTREDADRAIRDLDGKELRGKIVRVADDSVSGTVLNFCRSVLKTLLALWSR
ncbi:RNA-binding domain-containing protein [Armillaria gallica]|uniref:RNA-binding domain-containing protein n=1 Tax=Armillaria gallica TaxID=47427 RepID=A0A2H3DCV8_ARMGA|nr:RNA-binding domain-containing protein [Armillaria gallica]